MQEPTTDAEFEEAIAAAGYRFLDLGGQFAVVNKARGGRTFLEATEMSEALFEAWSLVKPDETECRGGG